MRPSFSKYPTAALAVVLLVSAAAFAKEDAAGKTFLWKASSANNTLYLLGSIHVATEDFYPLPDSIEKAFDSSKNLVVEVNMDGDAETQQKMMKLVMDKGTYKEGDSLSKKISKPTYDLLKSYSEKKGLPLDRLEMFRPWALSMTLTMMEFQALGFKPELGIDMHFLKAAKDKKPILELETAESQVNLMAGFSDELQEKFLLLTLTDVDDMKTKAKKMADAWKSGDAPGLETLMVKESLTKHPELKPVMEKMIDERNVPMAEKLDGYLKSKEIHFVVVGAGHLIGEKGIVNLLQKKGYKLEQIGK